MNLGSPDPKFKLGLKTHRNAFRGNVMKTKQVNTGSMQREAEMLLACLLGRREWTRGWGGVDEVGGGKGLSQAP